MTGSTGHVRVIPQVPILCQWRAFLKHDIVRYDTYARLPDKVALT